MRHSTPARRVPCRHLASSTLRRASGDTSRRRAYLYDCALARRSGADASTDPRAIAHHCCCCRRQKRASSATGAWNSPARLGKQTRRVTTAHQLGKITRPAPGEGRLHPPVALLPQHAHSTGRERWRRPRTAGRGALWRGQSGDVYARVLPAGLCLSDHRLARIASPSLVHREALYASGQRRTSVPVCTGEVSSQDEAVEIQSDEHMILILDGGVEWSSLALDLLVILVETLHSPITTHQLLLSSAALTPDTSSIPLSLHHSCRPSSSVPRRLPIRDTHQHVSQTDDYLYAVLPAAPQHCSSAAAPSSMPAASSVP
ncbi:hypothetical protein MRB53_039960 [Persea americana]|nr:hypothetical protein MRB53_039960 [Persea americana]